MPVEPSAADVQAEIISAMNHAMKEMVAENADSQLELVNTMNAAQMAQMQDAAGEAAGVQAEIVNAMGRAAQSMR